MGSGPNSHGVVEVLAGPKGKPVTFHTATGVDEYVLDDVIDTYIDWREQSRNVWLAYGRWSQAPPEDATLRFAAYLAELDQEHRACYLYERAIVRTTARLSAQNA